MSNGEAAVGALSDEIEQAIEDIRERSGAATCQAHGALARGVIVLLRCERRELAQTRRHLAVASLTAALVSGLITGALLFLAR